MPRPSQPLAHGAAVAEVLHLFELLRTPPIPTMNQSSKPLAGVIA